MYSKAAISSIAYRLSKICLFICVFSSVLPAFSATWTIGGQDADFDGLSRALSSSEVSSGDTLVLAPGTYREPSTVIDKAVDLKASDPLDRPVLMPAQDAEGIWMDITAEGKSNWQDVQFDTSDAHGLFTAVRINSAQADLNFTNAAFTALVGGISIEKGSLSLLSCRLDSAPIEVSEASILTARRSYLRQSPLHIAGEEGQVTLVNCVVAWSSPTYGNTEFIVNHAPAINGTLTGDLQVLQGESISLNSGAEVSGDLYVPGEPAVHVNGTAAFSGVVAGEGALDPDDYSINLNSGAELGHLVTRQDPIETLSIATPLTSTGTQQLTLNSPGDVPEDFRAY